MSEQKTGSYRELTDEEARLKAIEMGARDWAAYGGDPYAPDCSPVRAMAIAANLKEHQLACRHPNTSREAR